MNRPHYILLLFTFVILPLQYFVAQTNLVYNGDFEIYDTCPSYIAIPSSYQLQHCLGWSTPTYATSDYFHSCTEPAAEVGIPLNFVGYQIPYSGQAYCGLIAYGLDHGGCNYSGEYWWEYIQGQFVHPLESGRTYQIGFYVSLAENSTLVINQLGYHISDVPVGSCNSAPLDLTPQITSENGVFIDDTSTWVLVTGNYTAAGGEKYLTIGNFKDSIFTDTMTFNGLGTWPMAYYYVDGCTVFDITDNIQSNMFTPNDDGINDSFQIMGLADDDHFLIMNRWGNLIFEGNKKTPWNGTDQKGDPVNEGVFFYRVYSSNDNEVLKTGFIHLIR
ncbi:MAG TPA: gliding motility-associated C-terminal domain-containing protein [Fluviicola sp.]|nr:gliding motility-associated C-terminal domain-containing protein [Fluviicola sp.]